MGVIPTRKATLKAIVSEKRRGASFEIPVSCVNTLSVEGIDFSRNCTRNNSKEEILIPASFSKAEWALRPNKLGVDRDGLAVIFDMRLGRFRRVVRCVFVVTADGLRDGPVPLVPANRRSTVGS
jgi:hypothetical protein